ncbi:hypothetical protein PRZ48_009906 [Zasmidium cellare]|uniref:Heterokaryon incompatibility domain-containing protein n=1 Tax=Zasmidium cellare TaxID=395010 RepID=A0ABR0ED41_ZASCE|nr:hypothetical protein PRZ48_009906 [Zasmidium cellare]
MCLAYPYRLLDPDKREIRLLRFETTSHRRTGEQVECEVDHVSLTATPHVVYHAISYTWGQDPKMVPITLDGAETLVPESAVAALRGTCYSSYNRSTPVWIDAICINQRDLDEKAKQVAFMGEIYSKAQRVLIWLGDDDGSTVLARKTLLRLASECLRMTNNGREIEAHLESKVDPDNPRPYTLTPPPPGCDWPSFFTFFALPWFNRLWVMQEVILARMASCYCGNIVLAWHTIKVAVRWLAHRMAFNPQMQNIILFNVKNSTGPIGWVNITWLCNVQGFDWLEMPLHVLLSAAVSRQVTEPRDKIYGLLGLIRGSLRHSRDIQSLLTPHYGRPLKDLYVEAAWLALKTDESLHMLSGPLAALDKESRKSGRFAGFPTWVPTLESVLDTGTSLIASRATHLHASLDLTPRFSRDGGNSDILKVDGLVVDEIVSRHVAFTGGERTENVSRIVAGNIEYIVSLFVSGHLPGTTETLKSVAATIVAGVYGDTGDADNAPRLIPDFCAFALASLQTARLWPKNPLRDVSKERLWGLVNQLQAHIVAGKGDKIAYENATVLHPGTRAFIRTAGGRIGAASMVTKKGDRICIFHGSDLVFVLREKGPYWIIVEVAYVYGIAKGEYIHELREKGVLESQTVQKTLNLESVSSQSHPSRLHHQDHNMKPVLVASNEAARRNLDTRSSTNIETTNADSGPRATGHVETQVEKSEQGLDPNRQRDQLALAQHLLQNLSLNGSTDDTDTSTETGAFDLTQQPNATITESNHDTVGQNQLEIEIEIIEEERQKTLAEIRTLKKQRRDRLKREYNQRRRSTGGLSDGIEELLQQSGKSYLSPAGVLLGQEELPRL